MKKLILAGATSQTIDLFIQNSSLTTGGGLTGLVFNTASLTAYYRKGATGTATAITLATQTVGGAFSSGGFVEIDATNMPGMYRLDMPNAAIDTAGSTSLMLKGAANMAQLPIELQLTGFDPAASLATPTNITAGTIATVTNVTTVNGLAAGVITAASIAADAITDAKVAADVTIASVTGAVGSVTGAVGSVTGAVGSVTANVNAVLTNGAHGGAAATAQFGGAGGITSTLTGSLTGSVGSVTGAVGSVTGAVGSVTGAVASVTAAVSVTSNTKKNQALANFEFMMTDSTNHLPVTAKTVTVTRSIDGAAFAAGTLSAVTEVAFGIYRVDFAAADLNGNTVTLRCTAATSDDTFVTLVTAP